MKLSHLYNKELREKLLKEDLDDFLKKYSDFMDEQINALNSLQHFTQAQQYIICSIIDEWYLEFDKQMIVNDDGSKIHRLGYAKERLKERLCGFKTKLDIKDNCDGQ